MNRGWIGRLGGGRLLVLLGLLALTAWSLTRSDALARALEAEPRASDPTALAQTLRLALEHLERRPWSREAAALAGRCLSRLDHPDRAEAYYQRAGRLSRNDEAARAYAIVRANRRDDAVAAYKAMLERWPDDLEALRMLSGLYYTRKMYDEGIEVARRLLNHPGSEAEAHWRLAMMYHESSSPEPAVAEYEALVQVDPELRVVPAEARVFHWFQFASDLLSIGRAAEAQRYLNLALQRHEDPTLRILLGQAAFQQRDFETAETCWRQVVERDPNQAKAWEELGRLALARQQPAQAVEALERAAALTPNDFTTLYTLQNALRQAGQAERAEVVRQRVEVIRGHSPPPVKGMGANQMAQPGASKPRTTPSPSSPSTPETDR